jgi:hypothetical protein
MPETNRVVIHFADGRLAKGTTIDFNPSQPKFHLLPPGGGAGEAVMISSLKAAFFVKSLDTQARQGSTRRGFEAPRGVNAQGKKIAVLFKDGELLCGYTLNYVAGREGFFMFPADPDTNNIRIFVVNAAASQVATGPQAEALAARLAAEKKGQSIKA